MTQKKAEPDKISLTISLKYSVYLDAFEQAAEEKFPQLNLIQVGNFTANDSNEFAQQLANDDLTDIVITWPMDNAARNCEGKLVDLSGEKFTARYHLSMLNGLSQGGKLYYLPGPTQLRGILFNKTMFDENSWEVPSNFEEFVALCKTIEASGMRSLQLSFWNKEVLRYAFAGFGYTQSFATPQAAQALRDYNNGKGSLGDFAAPAFESFERLMAEGVLKPEDLDVRYPMREQMLYKRQCAMVSEGMALIPAARAAGNTDEFVLMPFFSPGEGGAWGHLIPTQYIGLNANLEKPEHKEKYDMALQLMEFISTPEGQLALANGNDTMISSLTGAELPDVPELRYMQEAIQGGRYAIFPSYTNINDALYQALAAMLRGEITRPEALSRIDGENRAPTPPPTPPVIGTATETFSLVETGNFVTDVLRTKAGTDLALFLDNGKDGKFNARGVSAKMYKGNIIETDVTHRVFPVLQHGEAGYLQIATMTGKNLLTALEHTLPDGDWFYYFSGLRLRYDPAAQPGARVKTITDDKGGSIQPTKLYTVAILEGSVQQELTDSIQTTDLLVKELLVEAIRERGSISPSKDGRFSIP